jgi:hypothetical protein
VYGNVTPQQGVPLSSLGGADWTVPANLSGTLIGIGGHMHPGGIRDEVSLVRKINDVEQEKPIFFSEAVPWDRAESGGDPANAGVYDQLTSWDFSMTVTGSTVGWKVRIKPGDKLRLNAVYDAQQASWYENMGIVVAMVAADSDGPDAVDALHGGPSVDVFDDPVTLDSGRLPDMATLAPAWNAGVPTCNADLASAQKTLCLRGGVTHGHMAEASHHGGPEGSPITAAPGPIVSQLVSVGFTYGAADLGVIGQTGIPRLMVNKPATFYNVDSPLDIWHTWTRCKEPCSGATGIAFPIANGSAGLGDGMDFDSTEIGYGLFFSPASGQFGSSNKTPGEALKDGLYWQFTPTQTGVYSLFCRIHPFMRGAFEVVSQ